MNPKDAKDMKKTIELSVIADAIEMATSERHQFYHVGTGELRSLPDGYSGYMNAEEYEREAEEIDESPDFVRLPDQRDRDDYSIMEAFAEAVDREELFRALHGRRPFRAFKDCAIRLGLIEAYYAFHGGVCVELAKEWCEVHKIPYITDKKTQAALEAAKRAVPEPEPEPTITMLLRYKGKNGAARCFAEEMLSSGTVAAIRTEEGNLGYEYYLSLEDPETLLLLDSWRNQAALDAHHASPMMATIAALREKYDLHMTAERYTGEEIRSDTRFIRK